MNKSVSLGLALSLCALTPAFAQQSKLDASVSVEVPPGEGRVLVEQLVKAWAKQTGRRAYVSPQVSGLKASLGVGSHTFNRTEVLALLADLQVVVVEDSSRVRAFRARDVSSRVGSTQLRVYTNDDKLPKMNTPVSLVYRIQHGAGQALFAQLRGILARDVTRYGNILYLQGAEQIVITDFAPKVAYYRQLIRAMDQPPAARAQQVTVYEVPGELWARLKHLPASEASIKLAKQFTEQRVTRLEQARVAGHKFSLQRSLTGKDGERLQVGVRVYVPRPAKGQVVHAGSKRKPRLSISMYRSGKGEERLERQIELAAPQATQAAIVSAMLGSDDASSHLVVTFSPIP